MYTLCIKCSDGERIVSFTEKEEARQELIRLLDDGHLTNYRYQLYLGFLLNGYESVMIENETAFEITVPAPIEVESE